MMLCVWTDLLPDLAPFQLSMSSPDEVEVGGVAGTSWRIEVYHSCFPAFRKPLEHPKLRIRPYLDPQKRNPYHQHRSPQKVFWKCDMGFLFADEIFPLIWRWHLNTSYSPEKPRRCHVLRTVSVLNDKYCQAPATPLKYITNSFFVRKVYQLFKGKT